jgi:hypothetical protein
MSTDNRGQLFVRSGTQNASFRTVFILIRKAVSERKVGKCPNSGEHRVGCHWRMASTVSLMPTLGYWRRMGRRMDTFAVTWNPSTAFDCSSVTKVGAV